MSREKTREKLAKVSALVLRMEQQMDSSAEEFATGFLEDCLEAQGLLAFIVTEIAGTAILHLCAERSDPIP